MRIIEQKIADAIKARRRFMGGNTSVTMIYNDMAVSFHGNLIADIAPGQCVVLDSCGWRTPTTKSRINTILWALGSPVSVYQKNHEWLLDGGLYHSEPFHDGVVVAI